MTMAARLAMLSPMGLLVDPSRSQDIDWVHQALNTVGASNMRHQSEDVPGFCLRHEVLPFFRGKHFHRACLSRNFMIDTIS